MSKRSKIDRAKSFGAHNVKVKIRKYMDTYLDFGFTFVDQDGIQKPLCVVCGEVLSNQVMVPSKMQRHMDTKHSNLRGKNRIYFQQLLDGQKKQSNMFTKVHLANDMAQEASFHVTQLVAKSMKPHNVVESLIMPACQIMVKTMLGDKAEKVISRMPFSNNTIQRRMDMMSRDIDSQICELLRSKQRFSLQIDESTDIGGKAQLMAFVRYSDEGTMKEQFLFCRQLIETKGEDIFKSVHSYFNTNGLSWQWCTSVCTDGAPAMRGKLKGFFSHVKSMNPNITTTHCFIHREVLVSKTLGKELQTILNGVVKIVNSIKTKPVKARIFEKICKDLGSDHCTLLLHTEIRWLSKGKVLSRFYELRQELCQFFQNEYCREEFVAMLTDPVWCCKLAYLVDIFEILNNLNTSMQGKNSNILAAEDKLKAFLCKIQMWKNEIQENTNLCMFPNTNLVDPEGAILRDIILEHLTNLAEKMVHYFPDIDMTDKDWVRFPFSPDLTLNSLTVVEKENLIEIRADRSLKLQFNYLSLTDFWIMIEQSDTGPLGLKAVNILLPFCTTYLCEKAFSTLTLIKTKQRSCLKNVEHDLRVCLSENIHPQIATLSKDLQGQPSH